MAITDFTDPNLTAIYTMDNISGSTLIDDSTATASQNATLVGSPVFVSGMDGDAIDLDGVNDHIDLIAFPDIAPAAFSISLWIKPKIFSVSNEFIFAHRNAGAAIANAVIEDTGLIRIYPPRNDASTLGTLSATAPVNMVLNQWHHVVLEFNIGGATNVYLDGVKGATGDMPSGVFTSTQTLLGAAIFTTPNVPERELTAELDQVRIFDRAMTAAEVSELYREFDGSILAFEHPNLTAGYTMDDITGTTLEDESANNNDGVLVSATTAEGLENASLVFDGANTLNMGSWFPNDPTVFSLSMWVKSDVNDTGTEVIFAHRDSDAGTTQIVIQKRVNNVFRLNVKNTADVGPTFVGGNIVTPVVDQTTWHHLVLNFAAGGDVELYLDGVLEVEGTTAIGPYTSTKTAIGAANVTGGLVQNYYLGKVEQARVYDRLLTQAEVTELYLELHVPDTFVFAPRTFAESIGDFTQEHIEIVEFDLPVVVGSCSLDGGDGFGTPRTCDEPTNATATYKFTKTNAPTMAHDNTVFAGTSLYRQITAISESPTQIKPGKGLASRGTLSITLNDFIGDPNPNAPGVTATVAAQGTFFGKLSARNNLVNSPIRLKLYRTGIHGTVNYDTGAQTRTYIIESLNNNGNGTWSLNAKDLLSIVNVDEFEWPPAEDNALRLDITDTATTIPLSITSVVAAGDVIRIGAELMSVVSVSDIGGVAAEAIVATRGADITRTNTLSETVKEAHSIGDEVFVCDIVDDEPIYDFLKRLLIAAGVPEAYIIVADWQAECDTWIGAGIKINTLWVEQKTIGKTLAGVLNDFLLDMWFDVITSTVKLSAINVWKKSVRELATDSEIDYKTLKMSPNESMRASRALVIYQKAFLANGDDLKEFARASTFKNVALETSDEYGVVKSKRFPYSTVLTKDGADLLVQRYVSRFGLAPRTFKWRTQENKLNVDVGDIVSINSDEEQSYDGSQGTATRAQVLSIKPSYRASREYSITALAFEQETEGVTGTYTLTGNIYEANLYIQAGRPPEAVNLTFVFDAATCFSGSVDIPSVKAGAFTAGSTITIIMINSTDWQGKGGDGGTSNSYGPGSFATGGGTCYDAEGIDTTIYFSGAAPGGYTADGYMRAPGGGGAAGAVMIGDPLTNLYYKVEAGGGGGAGITGLGGIGSDNTTTTDDGVNSTNLGVGGAGGVNGANVAGAGGGWGLQGATGTVSNSASLALLQSAAGKAIVNNGATVTAIGETAARLINGDGDVPL